MELGIYTDAGSLTCQQCPGSKGHEQLDLFTFAKEMGARYVKVDRCFAVDSEPMIEALPETFATQWVLLCSTHPPALLACYAMRCTLLQPVALRSRSLTVPPLLPRLLCFCLTFPPTSRLHMLSALL